MKCKNCGANLLDNDTFCSECGTRVKIEKCPQCNEILRDGVKFCSKCGYKIGDTVKNIIPEDEEIPVTGQMATVDIPFDLIEKNILMEAARQARDEEISERNNQNYYEESEYSEEDSIEYDDYKEYDNSEYDTEYDEEYEYEDEYDEYEEEQEKRSVISTLVTAGMIVIGLVIVLIVAALFFSNRKNKNNEKEEVVQEEIQNSDNEVIEEENDGFIGTITITEDVNIRDNPSTDDSTILGVARVGEEYSYYGFAENSENWIHIKVDDSTDGYVYKNYIKINE